MERSNLPEDRSNLEEETVILKCQNDECGWDNSADSIFCRHCGSWLIRQWKAVRWGKRLPISVDNVRIGTAYKDIIHMGREFRGTTEVNIHINIVAGANRDIIAHVEDRNGNVVAGNPLVTERRGRRERTREAATLTFQTFVPGEYTLVLDNTFSTFTAKRVVLTLDGF